MKNSLHIIAILFLSVGLSFNSCKKAETTTGLSDDIQNLVPDSLLQTIIDMGMPINEGTTPPNIENIYQASPFELVSSNRAGDSPGKLFSDFNIQFSDQNNSDLTVKVDYVNGPESGNGLGSFVSGSGNSFSVFVKVESYISGEKADLLQIISGTTTKSGIKDFYYSIFMLNNYGNPGGIWIENGEGRIIFDSDGDSPIVESLYSFKRDNQLMMSNQSVSSPFNMRK
jgi:hypothetical protein